jgi:hypothetical protein
MHLWKSCLTSCIETIGYPYVKTKAHPKKSPNYTSHGKQDLTENKPWNYRLNIKSKTQNSKRKH